MRLLKKKEKAASTSRLPSLGGASGSAALAPLSRRGSSLQPHMEEPSTDTRAMANGSSKIGSLWKGHLVRAAIKDQLSSVVSEPSIKASKAAQTASLPRDDKGKLLPIFCSVECFKVFGAGVYAYMRWQQYMAWVFGIAFAFACPNMLFNAFGGALPEGAGGVVVTTLGNVTSLNITYAVVEFFVCLTFLVALFHGRRLLEAAQEQVREEEAQLGGPSESTAWVRGLPADVKASDLKERLAAHFGDVRHVVIAYANRELLLRMAKRKPLLEDLYYRQALVYLARHARRPNQSNVKRLFEKLEAARARLQEHDQMTAKMAKQKYPCTGDAFVTFVSAEACRACIDHFGTRTQLSRDLQVIKTGVTALPGGHETERAVQLVSSGARHITSSLRSAAMMTRMHAACRGLGGGGGGAAVAPCSLDGAVERRGVGAADGGAVKSSPRPPLPELPAGLSSQAAPEPSDILWEGLSTSERERFWRQAGSTALTTLIACLGTAIIAVVTFFQGSGLLDQFITSLVDRPEGIVGIIFSLAMSLFAALPCIVGNVILFATTPLFADAIERHVTFSDKESTVYMKLTLFQIFNTFMSALAFLILTDWRLGRKWYVLGGSVVMTILGPLGDCVVIQSLLDWITLDMPLRRHLFAPRQKTQLGMDRLYIKESDLYLAFRVQVGGDGSYHAGPAPVHAPVHALVHAPAHIPEPSLKTSPVRSPRPRFVCAARLQVCGTLPRLWNGDAHALPLRLPLFCVRQPDRSPQPAAQPDTAAAHHRQADHECAHRFLPPRHLAARRARAALLPTAQSRRRVCAAHAAAARRAAAAPPYAHRAAPISAGRHRVAPRDRRVSHHRLRRLRRPGRGRLQVVHAASPGALQAMHRPCHHVRPPILTPRAANAAVREREPSRQGRRRRPSRRQRAPASADRSTTATPDVHAAPALENAARHLRGAARQAGKKRHVDKTKRPDAPSFQPQPCQQRMSRVLSVSSTAQCKAVHTQTTDQR